MWLTRPDPQNRSGGINVTFTGPGRTSFAAIVLAGLASLILAVSPAHAHKVSYHDFESVPEKIVPVALGAGIGFEMLDYDAQIRLRNESGREVIVKGYEGEPYARLAAGGGVYLNSKSPSFYMNRDRNATTEVDPSVDPSAPPEWVPVADNGELTWYDKRTHMMQTGMPPGIKDPTQSKAIRDFSIPLEVGGSPARLEGILYWAGRKEFPMGIVAGLLIATFLVAGLGVLAIESLRRAGPED